MSENRGPPRYNDAGNASKGAFRLGSRVHRAVRRLLANRGLSFGVKFVCLATLAAALDAFVVPTWWWLQATTVALVAHSVPVFGLSATTFGSKIAFADSEGMGFAYLVTPGCTAALPIFLYFAAVVAYPAAWKQRARGLLYGVVFLLALNVLRLSSMA